jgi:hypothetical protein
MLPIIKNHKVTLLALAALLVLLIQPFYTWFAADDFGYILSVKANGWVGNMVQEYLTWDGRSISLTYPVCRLGLWLGKYWVGPMIGTLLLLMAGILLITNNGFRIQGLQQSIQVTAVMGMLLWFACFPISSQTLYWTTGIGYNLDILLLLLAYAWMKKSWDKPWEKALAIPVFFYAGTCSPNGVLALLLVMGLEWLNGLVMEKKASHGRYILGFLLIITAFLLVVLSPGNARRMTDWDMRNLTHIWTVYFNLKRLLGNLLDYNGIVIWPMLVLGIWGSLATAGRQGLTLFQRLVHLLYQYRFLLAAAVSVLFFLPLPGMHAPRTNIQFMMFVVWYGLWGMQQLISNKTWQPDSAHFQRISSILLVLGIVVGLSQAFDARFVKQQLATRDAKLRTMRGQHVVLNEDDFVSTPATRVFEDLATDSSYWLNKGVADYYGLKSIKMVDTREKKVNYGQLTR